MSYSAKDTCSKCSNNYYVLNGQCNEVTTKVTYCIEYSDKTTCSKCQSEFLLVDNVCVPVEAKNCATYTSQTECSTCITGYGFKQEGNLYNCVLKNVSNCVSSEDTEPYKCYECVSHFYPLEGVCTAVTVIIDGCEFYATADTCKKCFSGAVLSIDKKNCVNQSYAVSKIDKNCDDS